MLSLAWDEDEKGIFICILIYGKPIAYLDLIESEVLADNLDGLLNVLLTSTPKERAKIKENDRNG